MSTSPATIAHNLAAVATFRQEPSGEAAEALRSTPTADLLRAAYALTHRIHEVEADRYNRGARHLREQRDLIDAEVIRRTDG